MSMDLDNPGECRQWADLFERTAKERDEYRRELTSLRLSNSALAAERDRLYADYSKLSAVLAVAHEERDTALAEVARMRAVYEAAIAYAPHIGPAPGDWACAECRPNSDMLHISPGWRCSHHALLAVVESTTPSKAGES